MPVESRLSPVFPPRTRGLPRTALAAALAGALALAAPIAACAQDATANPARDPGQPDPTDLDKIEVKANQLGTLTEGSGSYTPGTIATATRLVLTPRQTPQSISVIGRQEMDDFGLTGIDDVMRVTPGISIVTYDSERTEYYARGFAIQNFQYDGIPMQRDSAFSAGNTLSDTAIYDRIEVLKGATGLLTGVGDPGATINLIRKKPTRAFKGQIGLGAGSWDEYRGEIDVSGPLSESGRVRGRAVAVRQDKHGYSERYQRDTSVLYGILEADLGDDSLLTVGADYQNSDPRGSSWGGIPLLDADGGFYRVPRSFNNGADWSRWRQYTRTGFATLEHRFGDGWIAKLQLNHQVNGYDAALGAAAAGHPDPRDGSGVSLWLGKYVGETVANAADAYLSGRFGWFGREHEVVVGASVSRKHWTGTGYFAPADYPQQVADYRRWNGDIAEPAWQHGFDNDQVTRESGAYVVGRFDLADPFKLILGSRIANYKTDGIDESGVVVPYAGAVYDLNAYLSAYASYGTIFKPQSEQDERGRALDPREGENYELGLKGEFFDGRLNASAALFRLDQDNYPVPSGGKTPTGGDAYRALQGVRTEGYELELSGELRPGWQVQAGYAHKVARQNGAKVSTLEPEDQFSAHSSYRFDGALAGLTVGGGARWQSSSFGPVGAPGGGTVEHRTRPYWLLDAMLAYRFDEKLSASLNVDNLLDKRYYTIFDVYSTYTWGEARSVRVSATYRF
ncbi:TonB-dependent siderophore receptor [Lysobacter enzymogenes]|uniref:TonB-dependent siderophore receptor n=1 Tax=Lysobacter enzymogenes TaxID=69 RepID=UPI0020294BDC|nr:TonB-dependent siderophore receptor [Lysobacter enzymogenes]